MEWNTFFHNALKRQIRARLDLEFYNPLKIAMCVCFFRRFLCLCYYFFPFRYFCALFRRYILLLQEYQTLTLIIGACTCCNTMLSIGILVSLGVCATRPATPIKLIQQAALDKQRQRNKQRKISFSLMSVQGESRN